MIGLFIGSSIYQYYDYRVRPDFYEWQSAPWYLSIGVRGIYTVTAAIVLLTAMLIIKKNEKK